MRFRRHLKVEQSLKQIDIAPLIDVIFQLLIFFLLQSSFTYHKGITVKLPKAATSDTIKEENIIITITSENVTYLNGRIVTTKELEDFVKNPDYQKRPLLIKADRRASVGRIVDIWDLCRISGIERVNIATNAEN
ncbi:MAG: biopolymer transporter ExbD [Candidatus Omnitrophica bacterium]|nr:biopolymer transporter ExbD [Candidatus Omnitrophota bacterium]MCA9403355.1 biopolymer transporter ExbD [Candidatus Omnitrophota bacterium]MCB9721811.1 biopolymer transporter ExbD [Candidatus Omnitrophota bacterium]